MTDQPARLCQAKRRDGVTSCKHYALAGRDFCSIHHGPLGNWITEVAMLTPAEAILKLVANTQADLTRVIDAASAMGLDTAEIENARDSGYQQAMEQRNAQGDQPPTDT